MNLIIRSALPDHSISHFVHSFWLLENNTGKDIPTTILPNGMVDMMVMKMSSGNWEMILRGIDTVPSQVIIEAGMKMFSIGFKLLAVEYLLGSSIKDLLNEGKNIPNDFWKFEDDDMNSLENFCSKAMQKIKALSPENTDSRKKKLFELIYLSNGSITVKELSDSVYWSSRQINRYFNQQFGISLKTYCNILRFGASFKHISEGNLFPEQNFTDQNHFIKEIKKYAGVTPKELSKNKDDRFIDITAVRKLPS
ncbi:helix-turn-helix domain-containing protein [Pedobacter punctiformis]|uniref:AraC family transcriptional regulator n=1 Tax=Pedobacter punctiformis TaxID=3004097 RepID=A0ABT4L8P5_9SPHI|nr:AraC family transcriptional regulator [Pedobacter sp. HCMS5-2]MCZ4244282.1 AraC family transcriptional regulator [Pedobacter sp. HCMS5-2]